MIPKIIHYCWLSGDAYPELTKQCINSWKLQLPGYEIMLWDMNRDNVGNVNWVKDAFDARKYAFAADYVRFYALYHYGGIYLDADVEVLRSFNTLIEQPYFLGQEYSGDIEAAVMGSEPNAKWIEYCLNYYNNRSFVKEDGSYDMRPVPLLVNEAVKKYNLIVKPYTFFSPKNYYAGKIDMREDTYTIHHFDGKWEDNTFLLQAKRHVHSILFALLGRKGHNQIVKAIRKLLS